MTPSASWFSGLFFKKKNSGTIYNVLNEWVIALLFYLYQSVKTLKVEIGMEKQSAKKSPNLRTSFQPQTDMLKAQNGQTGARSSWQKVHEGY